MPFESRNYAVTNKVQTTDKSPRDKREQQFHIEIKIVVSRPLNAIQEFKLHGFVKCNPFWMQN